MNEKTDVQPIAKNQEVAERLVKCGFTEAAKELQLKKRLAQKLMMAYEHYRFMQLNVIHQFNYDLQRTERKTLEFIRIGSYGAVPPPEVLEALEKAQALTVDGVKVFDSYEVAVISEVRDPLLFGIVEGCTDKFFLAEWGDDVKISDLLKANEG